MKHFVIVLSILLMPVQAYAATYWVSKSGSAGSGCVNSPTPLTTTAKLTINQGMACMAGGDTLRIGPGTYAELLSDTNVGTPWPSGTSGAPTRVVAQDGRGSVIVRPTQGGVALAITQQQQWITIEDIIFDSIDQGATHHSSVWIGAIVYTDNPAAQAAHIELKNLEIKNAGSYGILLRGSAQHITGSHIHHHGRAASGSNCGLGIYQQSSDSLIEGNIISDNSHPSCSAGISGKGGETGTTRTNITIRNNIIRDNRQYGIVTRDTRNAIYNNILSGNGAGGNAAAVVLAGTDTLYNNTITANTTECLEASAASTIRNNICWANSLNTITAPSATISNNLTTDPKFINAAAANFQLQPTSAAINAGTSTAPTVTTDILGVARPVGAAYDIGAYEFVPAGGGGPTGVPGAPTGVSIQ